MKFKSVSIKNFRNFKDITVTLDNKNIFFGMNDVGKTNFLYALRYLFDKNVRKDGLIESDFYQKDISQSIEIIVSIDIKENDSDCEKLRSKIKGGLLSGQNEVYIKLVAEYNFEEMATDIVLYWGGDSNHLEEIKSRGYTFDIDGIFNVVCIDAYVDLYHLFKKNTSRLLKHNDEIDKDSIERINSKISELNNQISSLSGVKYFEKNITPRYNHLRNEAVEISVESEIAINGIFSNVIPYIKKSGQDKLYPTSGEGRKKLLVYAIYDLLAEDLDQLKINLFLIEEPENHLHKSLQLALSHQIFSSNKYKYIFMTTHSSYILSDMDEVNLIRIFNNTKIDSASFLYCVPPKFKLQKQRLNEKLSEAIFSDKVLLVEGPSEEILFDRVLSVKKPYYQAEGIYILPINGIAFEPYLDALKALKIHCVVKTDNDLQKFNSKKSNPNVTVLGFRRVNSLIKNKELPEIPIEENTDQAKRDLYESSKEVLDNIRINHHIYLSKVSLEEDLDEVIHNQLVEYLVNAKGNPVKYLKEQKKFNMIELVDHLTEEDCNNIYEHYNFQCLKDILE